MTNKASDSFHDIIKYSKKYPRYSYDSDLTQNKSQWWNLTHMESQQGTDSWWHSNHAAKAPLCSTMTHLAPLWLMVTYDDSDWLRMTHIISFNYK